MTMSEKDLRLLWQHQLFDQTRLHTTDGRRVVVSSAGSANDDGGPDFRSARVRIGATTYLGDVEVHLRTGQWFAHRHHIDPHYNNVILHVVLADDGVTTTTAGRRRIPVVALAPCLSDPPPVVVATAPVRMLPAASIRSMARVVAGERLEEKARMRGERLREITLEESRVDATAVSLQEQLLYEGIMEAMGYAKNRAPFLALARSVRLRLLRCFDLSDRTTMAAVLFGVAGLLPAPHSLTDAESRAYVRLLRRRWIEVRPLVRVPPLHPADWLFFRLRPANFPPARLAAVVNLLPVLFGTHALHDLLARTLETGVSVRPWWRELRTLFMVRPDAFWSDHLHFGAPVPVRRSIIGRERLLDLTANVLVPSALLFSRLSGIYNDAAGQCMELLTHLPAASSNTRTRWLRRSCSEPLHPANLLEHQGMIELTLRM